MRTNASPGVETSFPCSDERTQFRIQEYWEGIFAQEDPWNYSSDYEKIKFEQTLSLLPERPIGRAIELACAEGQFTVRLASRVGHLQASDISPTAIERARARCQQLQNVDFTILDLLTDDIPVDLDLIVCSEVLYFLPKLVLPTLAAKLSKHLKMGGQLLMAHANLVADDKTRTGFDWNHEFGCKTIGEVFSDCNELALAKELQTPLYAIQLFHKVPSGETLRPEITKLPINVAVTSNIERGIVWGGAVVTRSEAKTLERTSKVPILAYHSIAEEGPEELSSFRVTPAAFKEQLQYLRRNGYYSISICEWAAHIDAQKQLPGRPIIITFDDGYGDFLDNALPILERADFSAAVFVVTGKAGAVADWDRTSSKPMALMNWSDLRALHSRGFEIESHTASHKDLLTLSKEEILEEGIQARRDIHENLGKESCAVAFPYGRGSSVTAKVLSECGYCVGLDTSGGISTLAHDPMNLPRIEVFADDDIDSFAHKLERSDPKWQSSNMGCNTFHDPGNTSSEIQHLETDPFQGPILMTQSNSANDIASRLDALIAEFVSLQMKLLREASYQSPLQTKFCELFSRRLIDQVTVNVEPYQEITPGVWLGFEEFANVRLRVEPKLDHTASPESYLNIVDLRFKGPSRWLSIELSLDWDEICPASRFQISVYAQVNRLLTCKAVLRLPKKDGRYVDVNLAGFDLVPTERNANKAGGFVLPDFLDIDTSKKARLIVFLDSREDFALKLSYMNCYFS